MLIIFGNLASKNQFHIRVIGDGNCETRCETIVRKNHLSH
jgi:hypothetical protein